MSTQFVDKFTAMNILLNMFHPNQERNISICFYLSSAGMHTAEYANTTHTKYSTPDTGYHTTH